MKFNGYSSTIKTLVTNNATTLTNFIPQGYSVSTIRVYNNEATSITNVTLGTSVGGNQFIDLETIASGAWITVELNRFFSTSAATTVYFTCTEALTSLGVSIVAKTEYACLP